ncbi:MAG: hypothetical protein OJJ21_20235 [Ferrovibrio sp.]|nr:hypothetical protein [Ferrovibrio sp.]MCW0235937.1 hypothetical protein [Ferrovibrio sp.]
MLAGDSRSRRTAQRATAGLQLRGKPALFRGLDWRRKMALTEPE